MFALFYTLLHCNTSERLFNELLSGRMEGNEEITSLAFTNERFRELVVKNVAEESWGRVNG